MTLNSEHRAEKIRTKTQGNRNMKIQNTERWESSLAKRMGRKCRPIWTRTEQNNDHTQIMQKIGTYLCSFYTYNKII